MKHIAVFAIFFLAQGAFAVQKGFTCSTAAFSAEIETPISDPHGVAGIVTTDKGPEEVELYKAAEAPVEVPEDSVVYLGVGWGSGASNLVYLAVPNSLPWNKAGDQIMVMRIETHPKTIKRTVLNCNVDF